MYDVVISGCGVVGLIQALLLAQEPRLRLALVDIKVPRLDWSQARYDARVYAITPASQCLLEQLQVWPALLAKRVSPYTRMEVWEGQSGGHLSFDHAQCKVPVLGHILEENLLRAVLMEKLAQCPHVDFFCPRRCETLSEEKTYLELNAPGQTGFRTRLLIGADGAQSWVREQAGIVLQVHDYQHTALIAQVETELPHQKTARQVFLSAPDFPPGPLAFLPLAEARHCSLVWSTSASEAQRLLHLEEAAFRKLLARAFAFRLGKIHAVSQRQIFPLYERQAERYVKNRLALIGDAAHTLHPLAGQGVNLGIADAQALAVVLTQALQKGRDFASLPTLRRYERARKGTNQLMQNAVKGLKILFSSDNKTLSLLRSQGLIATNHLPFLKNLFAHYAMGTL